MLLRKVRTFAPLNFYPLAFIATTKSAIRKFVSMHLNEVGNLFLRFPIFLSLLGGFPKENMITFVDASSQGPC